jgi:hypothetical protein
MQRYTRRSVLLGLLGSSPLFGGTTKLAGIEFETIRNGKSNRSYLFIHGNEETAREVLRDHMKRHKGKAHLVMGKDRYVPLRGGRIDPNRLFSRVGAEANLKLMNKDMTAEEIARELNRLDRERPKLVKALLPPAGGLLVAVHNNSSAYSVQTEVPISDQTVLNDAGNPHEFFLATSPADFAILAKSRYNVVLQNKAPTEDDGSLSRLMTVRGVRYVNLECGLGKAERQREMLEWLESRL